MQCAAIFDELKEENIFILLYIYRFFSHFIANLKNLIWLSKKKNNAFLTDYV
jgi:hypothetical protein